jgi:hypothetical protein
VNALLPLRPILSFAAILSLVGLACAADKIALTCSGTLRSKSTQPPMAELRVSSETIIIDLDQGLVTTSTLGSFSVTKATDSKIDFEGATQDGETRTYGGVDRYSGVTILTSYRGKEILMTYNLTCKRANPLF